VQPDMERPQWTRPPTKGGILTIRDIAMLQSISTARYLTAEALEWLHMPGWSVRWQRHQAHENPPPYQISSRLYTRLRYLDEQGLIGRLMRTTQMGVSRLQRLPDVFFLTEDGARTIVQHTPLGMDDLSYFRNRPHSFITLNHGVLIGTLYAALRAKIESKLDVRMLRWQGEHHTRHAYDRLSVRYQTRLGTTSRQEIGLQPDATFVLEHPRGQERVFVEIDRDTRPLRTWAMKMRAYQAYWGSPALQARYGVDTFILLTVTTNLAQQRALMETTAGVLGDAHPRYLFALEDALHPLTIGHAWTKLSGMTPGTNPRRPTVQTVAHTFLN
jgi:hypothetical protein